MSWYDDALRLVVTRRGHLKSIITRYVPILHIVYQLWVPELTVY